MKNLIISPHTDDGIWSLGNTMESLENVTILSIFAGIPQDEAGMEKHTLLREEHKKACEILGVKYINGNFLDDVYGPQDEKKVTKWLQAKIREGNYDKVFVPLGIHHPDHILTRNIFLKNFTIDYFYEELPYRILYPKKTQQLRELYLSKSILSLAYSEYKEQAVMAYKSQIDQAVFEMVMQEEHIWKK